MSKDELQTEIAKMEQDLSNKLRIKFDDVLAQRQEEERQLAFEEMTEVHCMPYNFRLLL